MLLLLLSSASFAVTLQWSRLYAFADVVAVATNADGEVYAASEEWLSGSRHILVRKYARTGEELWAESVLEGLDFDVRDVAVDGEGGVFIAGIAKSAALPTTDGAAMPSFMGHRSGFVVKWNETPRAIEWATYVGGARHPYGHAALNDLNALSVGNDGVVFAIGTTNAADLPTTASTPGQALLGLHDDFAVALASDGSAIVWATYLGGSGGETTPGEDQRSQDVVLDSSGNPVFAGVTTSPDFPTSDGAHQSVLGGDQDLYVVSLTAATGELSWSTYLGGTGREERPSLAVGPEGDIIVAAATSAADFPTTAGVLQPERLLPATAAVEGVVAALGVGADLSWSTFYGGELAGECQSGGAEPLDGCAALVPKGLAIDSEGRIALAGKVAGVNLSTTPDALLRTAAGGADGFLAVLAKHAASLDYASYLGGSDEDTAVDVTVGLDDEIYVVGDTDSGNFPADEGAPGSWRGFAMMLSDPDSLIPLPKLLVNGMDAPISVENGSGVVIEVQLSAREYAGIEADWWVAATYSVNSRWYSYLGGGTGWVLAGETPLDLLPMSTEPLSDLLRSEVLNSSGLANGSYVVYFGVDLEPNGLLDLDQAYYARTTIDVE